MKNYLSLVFVLALALVSCGSSAGDSYSDKEPTKNDELIGVSVPIMEETDSIIDQSSSIEDSDVEKEIEIKEEEVDVKVLGTKDVIEKNESVEEIIQTDTDDLNTLFKKMDGLLSSYVSTLGKVNYKGLIAEKAKLDEFISQASAVNIDSDFSRNEQLSFWINLYNACTLKLICDNYPVKSIKEISAGKPWDLKVVEVNGTKYSLNEIENDIIRPKFNEPRIHFAVNCGANSCPKLLNRAFFPNNLEADLSIATQEFLADESQNQFDGDNASVSKIFEWYNADFGNLIQFLNKYSPHVISESGVVSFNEYDWSLNE